METDLDPVSQLQCELIATQAIVYALCYLGYDDKAAASTLKNLALQVVEKQSLPSPAHAARVRDSLESMLKPLG